MEITKQELARMYDEMTIREIQHALGDIGTTTLYRLLREAGIEKKNPARKPQRRINIKIIG